MSGESAEQRYRALREQRLQRLRDHRVQLVLLGVVAVVGGAVATQYALGSWLVGALIGLMIVGNRLVPSQQEIAWRKGARGEQIVGDALDALAPAALALHDRRMPGSRANIDHLLVTPTCVWTIDAKNYTGELETRRRGTELWIKGRNRSKLLDQARRQQGAVQQVLVQSGFGHVTVRPALCFLGVEWPLFLRPREAGDVALLSPRRLPDLAPDGQSLSPTARAVFDALDRSLRPAAPSPSGHATRKSSSSPPERQRTSTAPQATGGTTPTVKPWNRYGKRRLYVNEPDGTTLGYVDLDTNRIVPTDESHRDTVRSAVAAHLRTS